MCGRYSYTAVLSRPFVGIAVVTGQYKYVLIYSFELKSAFDAGSLFNAFSCQLVRHSLCFVAKVSEEVNYRKCRPRTRWYNFQSL